MSIIKNFIFKLLYKIYIKLKQYDEKLNYSKLRQKYDLDPSFRFNGNEILFYGEGKIKIGANSYIGRYSSIQSYKNYEVIIGHDCAISHNVRIYTTTTIAGDDWSNRPKRKKNASVIIEDYVWIGANVFINPGVTIGQCSVIGANSVVTKDIPPFTIFGGVPARLIKEKKPGKDSTV